MNKNIISAKLKRQMAEIQEMIELLRGSEHSDEIIDVLDKQEKATKELIQTINDPSFIPREVESLDIEPEIRKIEKKVEITKEGVEKLDKLEKNIHHQKEKIKKKILEDNK